MPAQSVRNEFQHITPKTCFSRPATSPAEPAAAAAAAAAAAGGGVETEPSEGAGSAMPARKDWADEK